MSDHNWCEVYKINNYFNFYRKCYDCGHIQVKHTQGWVVSTFSEFYSMYVFKEIPSCNELQMQRALG